MILAAEQELFRYCQVLFDLDSNTPRGFLDYIQISGLKSAYRKKVRETHPDLATGRSALVQRRKVDKFLVVQQAYENLTSYLEKRDRSKQPLKPTAWPRPQAAKAARQRSGSCHDWRATRRRPAQASAGGSVSARQPFPGQEKWSLDTLYKGPLPSRPLLLGHYLYYSGVINWRTIVDALVWQRKQRPRLGEIGRQQGWLDHQKVLAIMRGRKALTPFGEAAVRQGLLTDRQLKIMLYQQKRLARKFGEYFLESKVMTAADLERFLLRFHQHNRQFSNPPQ